MARAGSRTVWRSLLGGSAGAWAGMYLFHHKTKHWYFVVGMPLILAAQLAAGVWLAGNSGLVEQSERSAGAITVPQHRDTGRAFDFLG